MMFATRTFAFAVAIVVACIADLAKADPASGTLCGRVVAQARHLPASAWANGVEKAVTPALSIDKERDPVWNKDQDPSGFERSLTQLAWVRDALSNETGSWSEFVSRLPGQDIYMVSVYQGTLRCQTTAFIKARPGAKPELATSPALSGEGEGPCWTQSGMVGSVYGQPAYIEGGADSDHTFDASYKIVPWTDSGWGRECTIHMRFRPIYKLAERHCGDGAICREAAGQILPIARAYNAYRQNANAAGNFSFGPKAPQSIWDAIARASDGSARPTGPDFPTFGGQDTDDFSGTGTAYFPLRLNGRWRVAAVGHSGVGWRETNRTLIAIYDKEDGNLTPTAGFQIDAVNGGLIEAMEDGASPTSKSD